MCRNYESVFVHSIIIICLDSDFHLRSPTFVFLPALFRTPPTAPISTLVPVDLRDRVPAVLSAGSQNEMGYPNLFTGPKLDLRLDKILVLVDGDEV